MFSGTQEKCAACGKTAYPLEKVEFRNQMHLFCNHETLIFGCICPLLYSFVFKHEITTYWSVQWWLPYKSIWRVFCIANITSPSFSKRGSYNHLIKYA
ncbi:hypothetical protein Gogos_008976 [Gossypium gossypioides]|uniref:LIM zinc-binding domain-containing protein n=1 Tax=Gossypium gossypioides TaxID=34282 RepID=A0A7J9CE73_GOSGO|nr:hypothetical protein [Gossypium gossypioides]